MFAQRDHRARPQAARRGPEKSRQATPRHLQNTAKFTKLPGVIDVLLIVV
jgi:hypothetical protein